MWCVNTQMDYWSSPPHFNSIIGGYCHQVRCARVRQARCRIHFRRWKRHECRCQGQRGWTGSGVVEYEPPAPDCRRACHQRREPTTFRDGDNVDYALTPPQLRIIWQQSAAMSPRPIRHHGYQGDGHHAGRSNGRSRLATAGIRQGPVTAAENYPRGARPAALTSWFRPSIPILALSVPTPPKTEPDCPGRVRAGF